MTATRAIGEVEHLQDAVRETPRVLAVGGGSKPALSRPVSEDLLTLEMAPLQGVVDYDPQELTVTALAGTTVADLDSHLAPHGQWLPFDPPLGARGATLGGAVASGCAGPRAFKTGGVRDFVIGVRFVDGKGTLVRGGGRVVKNAAGFDLSKLMVGSLGRLGVLVELSLKVFPRPRPPITALMDFDNTGDALEALVRIGRSPLDALALDMVPPGLVIARFGAPATRLAERLNEIVGHSPFRLVEGDEESGLWDDACQLSWVRSDERLVRVALTLGRAPGILALVADSGGRARLSLGGGVAWVAWPGGVPLASLDRGLAALETGGLVLRGASGSPLLGNVAGGAFARRVRGALDPDCRFPRA